MWLFFHGRINLYSLDQVTSTTSKFNGVMVRYVDLKETPLKSSLIHSGYARSEIMVYVKPMSIMHPVAAPAYDSKSCLIGAASTRISETAWRTTLPSVYTLSSYLVSSFQIKLDVENRSPDRNPAALWLYSNRKTPVCFIELSPKVKLPEVHYTSDSNYSMEEECYAAGFFVREKDLVLLSPQENMMLRSGSIANAEE